MMTTAAMNSHPKVVLMYHSIAGDVPAITGSFPISMARFRHQIETLLQNGWQCAPLSRLRHEVDAPTFYITADDGTIDWTRNALPWCEQRKLPTHTAVVTGPWEPTPRYPLAHIIQVILALRSGKSLEKLATRISGMLTPQQQSHVEMAYSYEPDPIRRTIKGGCNLILTEHQAKQLLYPLSSAEQEALAHRFEKPNYYKSFHFAETGAHTVTHRALDQHTERYVRDEIEPCLTTMRQFGLVPSDYFTNPMKTKPGGFLENLAPLLRKIGFSGVLTCCGNWDQDSFVIPRIDAKQIEHHFGMEHNVG